MSKPNAFLLKMEAKAKEDARIAQYINERQCLDAMIRAINAEFGFGKERITRLIAKYIQTRREIADNMMADRFKNKDKTITYFKVDNDRAIKQIMGDDYPSHDERYTIDIRKSMYEGGVCIK